MRKYLRIFMVFLILFSLCGCENLISYKAHPQIKIGMTVSSENNFLNSICQTAQKAAMQNDVQIDILHAENNQKKQLKQIETWAKDGYAAVIVVLCDSTAAEDVLDKAGSMPVVFLNRCPSDHSVLKSRQNVIYIGGIESDAGRMQGEFLSEYFTAQNNNAPNIIVITGSKNDDTSSMRISAAKDAMSKDGLMPLYIYENSGGWDKDKTQKKIAKFLKDKPQIDAVLAANDAMAIGAAEALAQSGYALSEIPVVGVDATEEGRAAVREGVIDFTVYQDPDKQGGGAVNEIMRMLGGESPNVDADSIQWQEYVPVTTMNVDQMFPDDR